MITVAVPMGATVIRPHNSPAHSVRASVPPSHLAGGSLHIAFGHTLPVQRLWKIAIQLVGNKVAQSVLEVKRGSRVETTKSLDRRINSDGYVAKSARSRLQIAKILIIVGSHQMDIKVKGGTEWYGGKT